MDIESAKDKLDRMTIDDMCKEFDLTRKEVIGMMEEFDEYDDEPIIEEIDFTQPCKVIDFIDEDYYCIYCGKNQEYNKQQICKFCLMKQALEKVFSEMEDEKDDSKKLDQ